MADEIVGQNRIDGVNSIDPIQLKPSKLWIKDSKGNPSVSTTFVVIAFLVTTVAYVLSIVDHIGPFQVRAFDVGACAAFLMPTMALYFGRRMTESKTDEATKQ